MHKKVPGANCCDRLSLKFRFFRNTQVNRGKIQTPLRHQTEPPNRRGMTPYNQLVMHLQRSVTNIFPPLSHDTVLLILACVHAMHITPSGHWAAVVVIHAEVTHQHWARKKPKTPDYIFQTLAGSQSLVSSKPITAVRFPPHACQ